MTSQQVAELVQSRLPGAQVRARDLTGTGDHFELVVVSETFRGQPLLERHRLVFGTLQEELRGPIHALTLKTFSPEEDSSS